MKFVYGLDSFQNRTRVKFVYALDSFQNRTIVKFVYGLDSFHLAVSYFNNVSVFNFLGVSIISIKFDMHYIPAVASEVMPLGLESMYYILIH